MSIARIRTNDRDLMSVQDTLAGAIELLARGPFAGGNTVTDVALTTTATKVSHGLRRKPLGWLVVDKDANVDIWRVGDATAREMTLDASGAVTASIYFF